MDHDTREDDAVNATIEAHFNPAFSAWLNERDYTMLDWFNANTTIALVDEAEATFGLLTSYGYPIVGTAP